MIKFGEWLPDFGILKNPGATEARNVIPDEDGYRPFYTLSVTSTALNSYCRGLMAAVSNTGVAYQYAGSGSKLYQMSAGTWTDQSKASGTYTVNAGDSWEFAKWGETVIAVPGLGDVIQVIDIGATGSTEFADLGGTPPKAKHIAIVREFVVLGNLNESGANHPSRIRWSGINDSTHWTTSALKQSDYQPLEGDAGAVQAIRGGEYGVIFQEHSIRRMDYEGPPRVFTIAETLPGIGTPAPNSVVQWGDTIFCLSNHGFGAVINGSQWQDLSKDKITEWFFGRVDMDNAERIVGAIDYQNRRVYWIFPGSGNADGLPNEGVVFHLDSGRWSHFETEVEWIRNVYGEATTLEQLDSVSASIDALGVSLDSRLWKGGQILLMGFDSSHKSGEFTGTPLNARLETKEDSRLSNRSLITRVRAEIDGGTVTMNHGTRDNQADTVSWGATLSAERDGAYATRANARYHRFRCNISGEFNKAQGVSIPESVEMGSY